MEWFIVGGLVIVGLIIFNRDAREIANKSTGGLIKPMSGTGKGKRD